MYIMWNKGRTTNSTYIFIQGKGGRGCKENGVMLCVKCHQVMDNPIGKEQNKLANAYLNKCKNYLIREEKIEDIKVLQEKLKFNKIEYIEKKAQKQVIQEQKTTGNTKYNKKCKDCSMLIKSNNNSTIPSYYCKYRKIRLNKSTKICDKFKEK